MESHILSCNKCIIPEVANHSKGTSFSNSSERIKLQRLVGDILITQKLDLGKLDFNKEKTNVLEILNSVIKEFQPITEEKKILLEMNFDKDISIVTDKDRISQVFSNFN